MTAVCGDPGRPQIQRLFERMRAQKLLERRYPAITLTISAWFPRTAALGNDVWAGERPRLGALPTGSSSESSLAACGPVAERQVLAKNGPKPLVSFQARFAGRRMSGIGWKADMAQR